MTHHKKTAPPDAPGEAATTKENPEVISNQPTAYAGRHRLADTVVIALPPVAPMHGRLSRPLRQVPSPPRTDAIPVLRLLPPVAPDTADRLRLTPRGRKVRAAAGVLLALAACLALALATRGTVVTWDGLISVPDVAR